MLIDFHAHAYRKPVPFVTRFYSIEELLARDAELGIDRTVLLPVVSPEIYFPQANEDILDMRDAYPDRVIAFCNVDPRALSNSAHAKLDEVFAYYKERGCRGIGEVMPNLELQDPRVQNLFACAEKVGLPVIFDGSDVKTGDFGLYDDPGLPQLEHTLQKFPRLTLFGHGPVFWSEIARLETPGSRGFVFRRDGEQVGRLPQGKVTEEGVVPKLLRAYPNLMGDLSDFTAYNAFARDEDYGARFMTEFSDRLFFGTDLCSVGMPVPLPELLLRWRREGRISEEVFYKISRGNAERLLGLEG